MKMAYISIFPATRPLEIFGTFPKQPAQKEKKRSGEKPSPTPGFKKNPASWRLETL
jgi:hypothetical protein